MSQEIILTTIVVAIVSLVIGVLIGKSIGGNSETGAAVQGAKKELDDYKEAVSEHFGKTADLVDNLTESYKEVFEHLGSSARQLLSEDKVNQHLTSRASKAVTLTYINDVANKVSNPMAEAQSEIESEQVVDQAAADAEKMAKSISEASEDLAATINDDAEELASSVSDAAEKTLDSTKQN